MDAPTIGVLLDLTWLAFFAAVFGVITYRVLGPATEMNWRGHVDVRSFAVGDAFVLGSIALLLLGGLSGLSQASPSKEVTDTAMQLTVKTSLAGIVVQLGMCALLLAYLNVIRGLNLVDLFGLRQISPLMVLGIGVALMLPTLLCVGGSVYAVQTWMKEFWPDMSNQETVEAFRACKDPLAKALMVLSAAIIAPLVEETVFRGFFYGVLKKYTDGYFAAICTSLLFAVVHLHVGTIVPLTILALIFCAVYELTGSLLVPMVMHGLFNATSLVMMIFFPDIQ
jgi:membrane protease YdiL (CAAX protease family)